MTGDQAPVQFLSSHAVAFEPSVLPGTPAGAMVEQDRPCVNCGYSIRGLPVEGGCPECGTPLWRSLQGNLLRHASPAYLAQLHFGALFVEGGILLLIVGPIAAIAGMVLWASLGNTLGSMPALAPTILFTASSALLVGGWWLVSTPDPGAPPGAAGVRARKVLRGTVAVQAALFGASMAVQLAAFALSGVGANRAVDTLGALLGLGGTLAWLVTYFASTRYVRDIARRIPDHRLEQSSGTMIGLGAALMGVPAVLLGLFALAVVVGFAEGLVGGLACLGLPVFAIAVLVWFIMYVAFLDRLRAGVKQQRAALGGGPGAAPPSEVPPFLM